MPFFLLNMNCELSDVNFSGGGKGRGFIDDVEKKSLNVVIDWYYICI